MPAGNKGSTNYKTKYNLNTKMEIRNVKDSNGTLLAEGDSVTIIKSLKVKGSSSDLKRGQMVKNIRFTPSDKEIEGKVDKVLLVLKTEFLKKC